MNNKTHDYVAKSVSNSNCNAVATSQHRQVTAIATSSQRCEMSKSLRSHRRRPGMFAEMPAGCGGIAKPRPSNHAPRSICRRRLASLSPFFAAGMSPTIASPVARSTQQGDIHFSVRHIDDIRASGSRCRSFESDFHIPDMPPAAKILHGMVPILTTGPLTVEPERVHPSLPSLELARHRMWDPPTPKIQVASNATYETGLHVTYSQTDLATQQLPLGARHQGTNLWRASPTARKSSLSNVVCCTPAT